jgi:site-specific recombinase XerC
MSFRPITANRDRALFDLAIDSKLRGCDLVRVRIADLVAGGRIRNRAMVIQQKTKRPVQFELLEPARSSVLAWLERRGGGLDEFAVPSRVDRADHIGTRQYARLVDEWVTVIGLRREDYGTHSLRRTKAALIYKQTGNLRAVQILLGLRRSRQLSAIWALRSKTRSLWRKRSKYNDCNGKPVASEWKRDGRLVLMDRPSCALSGHPST